ncbi:MAG: protein-disulfide reductase DsbD, partial [Acidiferrobacterales bacterium]
MTRLLLAIVTLLGALSPAFAAHSELPRLELLEPDQAFSLSTRVIDAQTLEARWSIAQGYYMYRDKFRFEPMDDSLSLAAAVLPKGKEKTDPFFGTTEIYTNDVTVRIPIARRPGAAHVATVQVTAQGCNEPIGVCYPPITKQVRFDLAALTTPGTSVSERIESLKQLGDLIGGGDEIQEFLHPDQAYVLSVERVTENELLARFLIAQGYYLYRDKTRFALRASAGMPGDRATLGAYELPAGKRKLDPYFGETTVYYGEAAVRLPLTAAAGANADVRLQATYQGCAEKGICYPPITKDFDVRLGGGEIMAVAALDAVQAPATALGTTASTGSVTDAGRVRRGRGIGTLLLVVLAAFGTGLLLTFTPCVLPMIPILSSVIISQGDKHITHVRGGVVALTYVLGTAVTYTAIGVVAGATGDQLQAYFQNVWAIGLLSLIFLAMALSMFGFYELQVPAFLQSRLQQRTQGLGGTSLAGVFILGLVAALIVGACVAPLLISALGVAIASQDAFLGGVIMFSMALGMGVILVGVGIGAGALLPKAGAWMDRVKQVFGVMLLAVAIYLLGFVPGVPVLLLWSALLIVVAVYLGATQSLPKNAGGWHYLWKGIGTFLLIWGVLALLGGIAGGRDILRPLPVSLTGAGFSFDAGVRAPSEQTLVGGMAFERITSPEALER